MGPIISKICIALCISSLLIVAYIDRGDVWNLNRKKTVPISKSRGNKMFGWTPGATSVYMWLLSFLTAVEPEMKATQDQQTKFRKMLAILRTYCQSRMDSNTRKKTSVT
jgi:hypothetical protein